MARGWESKSVQNQVEAQGEEPGESDASPRAGKTAAELSGDAARARERQALELQRERILDERTSNPIRRKALEAALEEIEAKLAAL
jgi:hypothetical protein